MYGGYFFWSSWPPPERGVLLLAPDGYLRQRAAGRVRPGEHAGRCRFRCAGAAARRGAACRRSRTGGALAEPRQQRRPDARDGDRARRAQGFRGHGVSVAARPAHRRDGGQPAAGDGAAARDAARAGARQLRRGASRRRVHAGLRQRRAVRAVCARVPDPRHPRAGAALFRLLRALPARVRRAGFPEPALPRSAAGSDRRSHRSAGARRGGQARAAEGPLRVRRCGAREPVGRPEDHDPHGRPECGEGEGEAARARAASSLPGAQASGPARARSSAACRPRLRFAARAGPAGPPPIRRSA